MVRKRHVQQLTNFLYFSLIVVSLTVYYRLRCMLVYTNFLLEHKQLKIENHWMQVLQKQRFSLIVKVVFATLAVNLYRMCCLQTCFVVHLVLDKTETCQDFTPFLLQIVPISYLIPLFLIRILYPHLLLFTVFMLETFSILFHEKNRGYSLCAIL